MLLQQTVRPQRVPPHNAPLRVVGQTRTGEPPTSALSISDSPGGITNLSRALNEAHQIPSLGIANYQKENMNHIKGSSTNIWTVHVEVRAHRTQLSL